MTSKNRKILAALMVVLVLIVAATGTAYGYLSAASNEVTNTFSPATEVNPIIATNPSGSVHVSVGNTGYAVYVRAAIVVTWQKKDGTVYAQLPNYTVALGAGWEKASDGFYYYTSKVSESQVGALTKSITASADSKPPSDDYSLKVQVIVQTIQAEGMTDDGNKYAVEDAWDVTRNDNETITPHK